jgi:hypothetical protein
MKRWKLVTGVIIVFVLGILMGSLGTGLLYKYRVIRPVKPEPSAKRALILKRYSKALALSPEQTTGFKNIIDEMDVKRREFFKKNSPEMEKIREQGVVKMKTLLRPDQQDKLDKLHQMFRKRYKEKRKFRF